MTAKRPKIVAAVARIDKRPKPSKARKFAQARQIAAWQKKTSRRTA